MSRHAEMSTQFKARVDLPRGDVSVSERGWRFRVSGEVLGLCAVEYEFEGLLLDLHPSKSEILSAIEREHAGNALPRSRARDRALSSSVSVRPSLFRRRAACSKANVMVHAASA
jgi:hypothetical protein